MSLQNYCSGYERLNVVQFNFHGRIKLYRHFCCLRLAVVALGFTNGLKHYSLKLETNGQNIAG